MCRRSETRSARWASHLADGKTLDVEAVNRYSGSPCVRLSIALLIR
ncbi:hypothetical protein [Kibdelosporangium philippinense]